MRQGWPYTGPYTGRPNKVQYFCFAAANGNILEPEARGALALLPPVSFVSLANFCPDLPIYAEGLATYRAPAPPRHPPPPPRHEMHRCKRSQRWPFSGFFSSSRHVVAAKMPRGSLVRIFLSLFFSFQVSVNPPIVANHPSLKSE
mgnify:CR=1 FL=1